MRYYRRTPSYERNAWGATQNIYKNKPNNTNTHAPNATNDTAKAKNCTPMNQTAEDPTRKYTTRAIGSQTNGNKIKRKDDAHMTKTTRWLQPPRRRHGRTATPDTNTSPPYRNEAPPPIPGTNHNNRQTPPPYQNDAPPPTRKQEATVRKQTNRTLQRTKT